ncbi:MAG: hypothetical protein ACE5R4_18740 [Armatimonadota bacterium]
MQAKRLVMIGVGLIVVVGPMVAWTADEGEEAFAVRMELPTVVASKYGDLMWMVESKQLRAQVRLTLEESSLSALRGDDPGVAAKLDVSVHRRTEGGRRLAEGLAADFSSTDRRVQGRLVLAPGGTYPVAEGVELRVGELEGKVLPVSLVLVE